MSEDLQYALAAKEAYGNDGEVAPLAALGPRMLMEFAEAEADRRITELRWLMDLRQFRGQYDPEVLALIGPKRSRAFVRKTRVKVKTANSRVEDLLFPSGTEKNYEVDTSPKPSVPKEIRTGIIQQLTMMAKQAMQQDQSMQVPPITKDVVEKAVLQVCKEAAKAMSSTIEDQLTEVRYKQICKQVINSAHLYGTGVLKGPLVERRVRSRFVNENGKWVEKSEAYIVPFIDYVPLWRLYPDMGADELSKCRYIFERHQMTHADLAELSQRKSFRGEVIKAYLESHPRGETTVKFIDNELKIIGDRNSKQGNNDGKYEVLERWGWLTGDDLKQAGVDVKDDRLHESFFSNVWLLPNGEVIKAVLQPINGVTWPYHFYYFDKDETSIFGEGLATVMRDDQTMINAATRLMLDNGALTSGSMLEVNTGLLSSMEDGTEAYPWKVYLRNSQQPGVPAVRAIDLQSRLQDLGGLADRFENNADEVSAIPRYMTGENQSQGAAGTASGMSMLLGAANIMIKDLISAWDEGVTRPFIEAMYRWNMQFNPDNSIKGDFCVSAKGSSSLVAREVRAQQLDQFSQMVANPMDAPFIKRDKLLRQRAEAHELSDIVKTEEEVKAEQNNGQLAMQAQLQQQMQQLQLAEQGQKVALLTAQAAQASANVALTNAKAMESKVAAIYAALEAGGVATSNPRIAPAGDEILRSSGWKDATPDPSIAQLDTTPVQQATESVAPDPSMQGIDPNTHPNAPANPQIPQVQAPQPDSADSAPTGQVGMHAGIETPRVTDGQA
jgi:hypothetical protein